MAKIYISSTYEDLKDHRKAVYETLRQWRHDVIAMEDYVACDQRPLDKCLEDVSQCNVYIGLFAWRYGFIPDGQSKSITQLEYECAVKSGMPCYIFIIDKGASWLPAYIDDDKRNINSFKNKLQNNHVVNFFTTIDNLRAVVSVSLKDIPIDPINETSRTSEKKLVNHPQKIRNTIKPLTYYSMDRYEQIDRMDVWFKTFASKNPSPHFAGIFHGKDHHEPARFFRIMKNKWCNYQTDLNVNFYEHLNWPDIDTLDQYFELSVLSKIHDRMSQDLSYQCDFTFETITKQLNEDKGPLVFDFKVHSSKLKNCEQDISNFLNIFSKWPQRQSGPLIVLLTIIYGQASASKKPKKRFFRKWFKKSSPVADPDTSIRKSLQKLPLDKFSFTQTFVFKEFSLITYEHTKDWLNTYFDSNMDEYLVLDRIIDALYTPKDKTYPLKELAETIRDRFETNNSSDH